MKLKRKLLLSDFLLCKIPLVYKIQLEVRLRLRSLLENVAIYILLCFQLEKLCMQIFSRIEHVLLI